MNNSDNKFEYLLFAIPLFGFGLMGALTGFVAKNGDPLQGFMWGILVGIILTVAIITFEHAKDWLTSQMNKGNLLPYILVGIIIAIAFCVYTATTLGKPSCLDSDTERGTCYEYADDGFEPTDTQRWNKFWSSIPISVIVASLVATIIHSNTHKKMKDNTKK